MLQLDKLLNGSFETTKWDWVILKYTVKALTVFFFCHLNTNAVNLS